MVGVVPERLRLGVRVEDDAATDLNVAVLDGATVEEDAERVPPGAVLGAEDPHDLEAWVLTRDGQAPVSGGSAGGR